MVALTGHVHCIHTVQNPPAKTANTMVMTSPDENEAITKAPPVIRPPTMTHVRVPKRLLRGAATGPNKTVK